MATRIVPESLPAEETCRLIAEKWGTSCQVSTKPFLLRRRGKKSVLLSVSFEKDPEGRALLELDNWLEASGAF